MSDSENVSAETRATARRRTARRRRQVLAFARTDAANEWQLPGCLVGIVDHVYPLLMVVQM